MIQTEKRRLVGCVDESVYPVITEDPVIEPAPADSPFVPVNPNQYDQPILIGQ